MAMDMDLAVAEVERRPGGRTNRQRPQSLRSSSTSTGAKDMESYLMDGGVDKNGRRILMKDSFR